MRIALLLGLFLLFGLAFALQSTLGKQAEAKGSSANVLQLKVGGDQPRLRLDPVADPGFATLRPGESLEQLCERVLGDRNQVGALLAANQLDALQARRLSAGTRLKLPEGKRRR